MGICEVEQREGNDEETIIQNNSLLKMKENKKKENNLKNKSNNEEVERNLENVEEEKEKKKNENENEKKIINEKTTEKMKRMTEEEKKEKLVVGEHKNKEEKEAIKCSEGSILDNEDFVNKNVASKCFGKNSSFFQDTENKEQNLLVSSVCTASSCSSPSSVSNKQQNEKKEDNIAVTDISSSSSFSLSSSSPLCNSTYSFSPGFSSSPSAASSSISASPSSSLIRIPPPLLEMDATAEMMDIFYSFCKMTEEYHKELNVPTANYINGEYRCFRFLLGYNFDLSTALNVYKKQLEWRQQQNIDERMIKFIKEEMLENLSPESAPLHDKILFHFPMNLLLRNKNNELLFDKEGNCISIERLGLIDEKRLNGEISEEQFINWQVYQLEFKCMLLDKLCRSSGKLIRTTFIYDLSGLSARCINRQILNILRCSISVASENYPEGAAYIFLLNSPKIFTTFWNSIKTWLKPRTLHKVFLLDSDYEDFLFKYIDKENLPPFLGGSNDSPKAQVPLTGLLSNDRFGLGDHSILIVNARKKEFLIYDVRAGSLISYSWGVLENDIAFSIKLKHQKSPCKTKEIVLVESKKYDSTKVVRGIVFVEFEGLVSVIWDNSWGILQNRTIHYKLEILTPEEIANQNTELNIIQNNHDDHCDRNTNDNSK